MLENGHVHRPQHRRARAVGYQQADELAWRKVVRDGPAGALPFGCRADAARRIVRSVLAHLGAPPLVSPAGRGVGAVALGAAVAVRYVRAGDVARG